MSQQLLKSIHFAAEKHRTQRRKDVAQTPYINHPIAVAETLRLHKIVDKNILIAAILHDTIEDTDTSPEEIADAFGKRVQKLVLEVTDDKSLPKLKRKEQQIEHAPNLSEGARLIKLADKICNVRDMVQSPPAGWPLERLQGYIDWCEAVIGNMKETHSELESLFKDVCREARAHFK